MTVLCNESTASAAEVFTAVMQDYGLATVVGMKTYGKGIMQTVRRITFADSVGYIKLTTHAYQTKRGTSYHGIGVIPDHIVELSEEAKQEALVILPQDQDEQLKTAVQLLLTVNQ
jgi:carboxyl-terminal processing protease